MRTSAFQDHATSRPSGPIVLAFDDRTAAGRLAALLLAGGDDVLLQSGESALLVAITRYDPKFVLTDIPLHTVDPYTLRQLHVAAERHPILVRSLPASDEGLRDLAHDLRHLIQGFCPGGPP